MANKKASTYGQIGACRLCRHLPRIASGDGDDSEHDHASPPVDQTPQREHPLYHIRPHHDSPLPPVSQERVAHSDDVAGVPGRSVRLSRDKTAKSTHASPLRLTRGLWADTQRHLLQAYEYLCQVGKAQQWIEGCLGQELGFGVLLPLTQTLQTIVRELAESSDLDHESDPSIVYIALFAGDKLSVEPQIHRARIDIEEMRSSRTSAKLIDLPFYEDIRCS